MKSRHLNRIAAAGLAVSFSLLGLSSSAQGAGVIVRHHGVYNQVLGGSCSRPTSLLVHGGHGAFALSAADPEAGGLLAEPTYEPGQEPAYVARVSDVSEVSTPQGNALRYRLLGYQEGCRSWSLDEPQLSYRFSTRESIAMGLSSSKLRATAAVIPADVENPHLRLLGNLIYPVISCRSTGMDTCSGYVQVRTLRPLLFRGHRRRLTLVEHSAFVQLAPGRSKRLEVQLWPPSHIHFVSREQEDAYAVQVEEAVYRQSVPISISVHYRDERRRAEVLTKTTTLVGPRHHAHCACIH